MSAEPLKPTPTRSSEAPPAARSGSSLRGLVKSGWTSMRKKKKSKLSNGEASVTTEDDDAKTNNTFLIHEDGASSTNTLAALVEEPTGMLDKPTASDVTTKTKNTSNILDLVVLLMDPVSHRFELLQLEFEDASKARVSDLLVQIPLSVTEDSLKKLVFDGILDENYYRASASVRGMTVLSSSKLIKTFGPGADTKENNHKMVLVAKPTGVSNAECLRLAKPILTNKDVSKMLELSGFDVSGWKTTKFPSRAAEKAERMSVSTDPKKLETSRIEKYGAVTPSKKKPQVAPVKNSNSSFVALGLVVTLLVGALLQSVLVKPVSPGTLLKPGTYKSKCGLFGYLSLFAPGWKETTAELLNSIEENLAPSFLLCEDEFFRVNYDGTATLYDSNRKATMILSGDLCETNSDESCTDGLLFDEAATLSMGGNRIKQVLVRKEKDRTLSPWPIEEEPSKLRYKIGSKKVFPTSN